MSVPQSLPMAIEAKRGVNLRNWDTVGRYGARGRCRIADTVRAAHLELVVARFHHPNLAV